MQIDDILYAHIGTGITVYDTSTKITTNYMVIATINANRIIDIKAPIKSDVLISIAQFAATQNPRIPNKPDVFVFNEYVSTTNTTDEAVVGFRREIPK